MTLFKAATAIGLCAALAQGAMALTVVMTRLTAGDLSLMAPDDAVLHAAGQHAWLLRAHGFSIGVVRGPSVADLDDSEPRRCYEIQRVEIDGRPAMLRKSLPSARLDCPENYVSVYLAPAGRGAPAVFAWGQGAYDIDIPVMAGILSSVRLRP